MTRRRFKIVAYEGSDIILEEYIDPLDEKRRQEAAEEARYQFEAEKLRQKLRAEKLAREEKERQQKWDQFRDHFQDSYFYSRGHSFNFQYTTREDESKVKRLSPEDVKKIYRELARKYHPDSGGSVREMQVLNEMNDKLKNITTNNGYIFSVVTNLSSKYPDADSRRVIEVFHTRIMNVVGV